jgi:hypothetical protein
VDWTFYHESIPKDRIGLVIELEAERMSKLVLRELQVTSEKEVVANERYRVDDDVEGAVSELSQHRLHDARYRWPTIGWMADIEGFTTGDCAGFYCTYYAPNNATTVIVGDIREKDILARIQWYAGLESAIPVEDILPSPRSWQSDGFRSRSRPRPTKSLSPTTALSRGRRPRSATMLTEVLFSDACAQFTARSSKSRSSAPSCAVVILQRSGPLRRSTRPLDRERPRGDLDSLDRELAGRQRAGHDCRARKGQG